jgi:hypothetical protein
MNVLSLWQLIKIIIIKTLWTAWTSNIIKDFINNYSSETTYSVTCESALAMVSQISEYLFLVHHNFVFPFLLFLFSLYYIFIVLCFISFQLFLIFLLVVFFLSFLFTLSVFRSLLLWSYASFHLSVSLHHSYSWTADFQFQAKNKKKRLLWTIFFLLMMCFQLFRVYNKELAAILLF